jgi:hypothetical protein
MKVNVSLLTAAALMLACACWGPRNTGRSSGSATDAGAGDDSVSSLMGSAPAIPAATRHFPSVQMPRVYGDDPAAAAEYAVEHYWDGFLNGEGPTTPKSVLGVLDEEVEQALANYIALLGEVKEDATPDNLAPLKMAQKGVKKFFSKIEERQLADTSAKTYLRLTEMVSHYLYDPNSPLRDEDLYLPFVEAAAESACTSDDMRNAYRYEARQCRTNPFGSKVPDFSYSDINGHKGSLYGVKADYTMLFFSNPGCESCKEIIKDVMGRGYIESMIANRKLAVVNIYIDEEVSKWRDYSHNYPSCWINGYDYTFSLRDSGKYDIRAIPSLYLLDSQKRVLMKDAITENVLKFLDKI